MIYGTDADLDFLNKILRIPGSCNLRISKTDAGEFPPVTTTADAQGRFFFLAGDVRISEHSFLFAQHTVRPHPCPVCCCATHLCPLHMHSCARSSVASCSVHEHPTYSSYQHLWQASSLVLLDVPRLSSRTARMSTSRRSCLANLARL